MTPRTNDNTTAPMATLPKVLDNNDWPLVDDNTTHTPNLLPKKGNSHNASICSVLSINGFSPCNTDNSNALANNDNCHQISAGNTTNMCVHLATLSPAPPCHDDEFFNYKLRLNEIDDACNQMMLSWPMARHMVPTSLQHLPYHKT